MTKMTPTEVALDYLKGSGWKMVYARDQVLELLALAIGAERAGFNVRDRPHPSAPYMDHAEPGADCGVLKSWFDDDGPHE